MLCVTIFTQGGRDYMVVSDPQPVDVSTCPHVLTSYAELGQSPFALTTEQATEIGGAILLVWGIAWVFRTFVRALHIDGHHSDKEDQS